MAGNGDSLWNRPANDLPSGAPSSPSSSSYWNHSRVQRPSADQRTSAALTRRDLPRRRSDDRRGDGSRWPEHEDRGGSSGQFGRDRELPDAGAKRPRYSNDDVERARDRDLDHRPRLDRAGEDDRARGAAFALSSDRPLHDGLDRPRDGAGGSSDDRPRFDRDADDHSRRGGADRFREDPGGRSYDRPRFDRPRFDRDADERPRRHGADRFRDDSGGRSCDRPRFDRDADDRPHREGGNQFRRPDEAGGGWVDRQHRHGYLDRRREETGGSSDDHPRIDRAADDRPRRDRMDRPREPDGNREGWVSRTRFGHDAVDRTGRDALNDPPEDDVGTPTSTPRSDLQQRPLVAAATISGRHFENVSDAECQSIHRTVLEAARTLTLPDELRSLELGKKFGIHTVVGTVLASREWIEAGPPLGTVVYGDTDGKHSVPAADGSWLFEANLKCAVSCSDGRPVNSTVERLVEGKPCVLVVSDPDQARSGGGFFAVVGQPLQDDPRIWVFVDGATPPQLSRLGVGVRSAPRPLLTEHVAPALFAGLLLDSAAACHPDRSRALTAELFPSASPLALVLRALYPDEAPLPSFAQVSAARQQSNVEPLP